MLDLVDAITRLQALGMAGSDPFAAGWMRLQANGLNTQVEVDLTGSTNGAQWVTLATLQGVVTNLVTPQNFVQPVTLGGVQGEFRVNTTVTNDQNNSAIASLAGGGYVVTWTSNGQDGSGGGIYAQRYGAGGVTLGAETRVNTATANDQSQAAITALTNGDYVITWASYLQDGGINGGYGIYAQRYNAAGVTQGAETLVDTTVSSSQLQPAVAALAGPGGGYVVTWSSFGQDGSGYGIFAQRYNASGATLGAETRINATVTNDQKESAITALADGGYMVTWMTNQRAGTDYDIYAQRYDTSGAPVGAQTPIATTVLDQQQPAITALTGGGYVVTWTSYAQDGSLGGIYAQRYNAGGATAGAETRINTTTANDQSQTAITALADGGYVITWSSFLRDGSGYGVYAQRYNASGAAVGNEALVNTTTANEQSRPAISTLADGGYVITWTSALQDGSGYGVYAREFHPGAANTPPIAAPDSAVTALNAAVTVDVRGNDNEPDGDALSVSAVTQGASGLVTIDVATGNPKYTPNTNFVGFDSFNYTISDGHGGTATAAVNVTVASQMGDNNANTLTGTNAADVIAALSGIDTINASGGNDYVDAGDGNDIITGGAGADTLLGGAGNDTFRVTGTELAGDVIDGGANSDTLQFTGNVTLSGGFTMSNVETLNMGGFTLGVQTTTAINLSGLALLNGGVINGDGAANTITGTQGADNINGAGGNDLLKGGAGIDTLHGGAGVDVIVGGTGNDLLFGSANSAGDGSADTFVFNTALNATTNKDTITGFEANALDKMALDPAFFAAVALNGTAGLDATEFKANAGGNATDGNDYIVYDSATGNLYYDADGSGVGAKVLFATLVGLTGTLDNTDFTTTLPAGA